MPLRSPTSTVIERLKGLASELSSTTDHFNNDDYELSEAESHSHPEDLTTPNLGMTMNLAMTTMRRKKVIFARMGITRSWKASGTDVSVAHVRSTLRLAPRGSI